jgi:hypothetical protein
MKTVDRYLPRPQYWDVGGRLTKPLLVALVGALVLAPSAQAKRHYLRFKVTSVTGAQTVSWHDSIGYGDCGAITRSGIQTIVFKSTRPARLKLLRTGRHNASGENFIRANWTFTRSFQQSPPPVCPAEPAFARLAQAPDCGTQGPFPVPIDVGWRDGKVSLRGVLDPQSQRHPVYKTCRYDGFHNEDLVDSAGRLSWKRLTGRRKTLKVKVAKKLTEPTPEADGSSTTSLKATVTLKRVR